MTNDTEGQLYESKVSSEETDPPRLILLRGGLLWSVAAMRGYVRGSSRTWTWEQLNSGDREAVFDYLADRAVRQIPAGRARDVPSDAWTCSHCGARELESIAGSTLASNSLICRDCGSFAGWIVAAGRAEDPEPIEPVEE